MAKKTKIKKKEQQKVEYVSESEIRFQGLDIVYCSGECGRTLGYMPPDVELATDDELAMFCSICARTLCAGAQ